MSGENRVVLEGTIVSTQDVRPGWRGGAGSTDVRIIIDTPDGLACGRWCDVHALPIPSFQGGDVVHLEGKVRYFHAGDIAGVRQMRTEVLLDEVSVVSR